jgi:hypothetical protein
MSTGQVLESSPTTQDTILKAVRALLIEKIPDFSEKNVAISDEDEAPAGMRSYYYCTIWPGGGNFDEAAFVGAGIYGVNEYAVVAITVYRRNPKDQAGHGDDMLLNPDNGLFELKRLILKTMVRATRLAWENKFLLIEQMRPTRSDEPRNMPHSTGKTGDVYLEFLTPFSWDLS